MDTKNTTNHEAHEGTTMQDSHIAGTKSLTDSDSDHYHIFKSSNFKLCRITINSEPSRTNVTHSFARLMEDYIRSNYFLRKDFRMILPCCIIIILQHRLLRRNHK